MQNKLQELTEKIYKEGLAKGTEEASQLLAKAKEDASKIVSDAKKQAEQIVAHAKKEAEDYRKNVDTEINISSRQVINGLKQNISQFIEKEVIETPLVDALKDTEFLKKIIETAISRWNPNSSERIDLVLLVPADLEKQMSDHIKNKASSVLFKGVDIQVDKGLKFGFKIGPKDGGYYISFSDNDFENLFRTYMRPRISEMLFGGK